MEYVWFIHAQFIQIESDKVKQEWNYYIKIYLKIAKVLEFPIVISFS